MVSIYISSMARGPHARLRKEAAPIIVMRHAAQCPTALSVCYCWRGVVLAPILSTRFPFATAQLRVSNRQSTICRLPHWDLVLVTHCTESIVFCKRSLRKA